MFATAGLSATVATGTLVTEIAATLLFPSLVAVMVAEPAVTPVSKPLALTVATAGALDAQVTTRPVSIVPDRSLVAAGKSVDAAASRLIKAELTATVATGTFATEIAAAPLLFPPLAALMWVPAAV